MVMTLYKSFGLALLLVFVGFVAFEASGYTSIPRGAIKGAVLFGLITAGLGYLSLFSLIANLVTEWVPPDITNNVEYKYLQQKARASEKADDVFKKLLGYTPFVLVGVALIAGSEDWWIPLFLLITLAFGNSRVRTEYDITDADTQKIRELETELKDKEEFENRRKQAQAFTHPLGGLDSIDAWRSLDPNTAAAKAAPLFELFVSPQDTPEVKDNTVLWQSNRTWYAAVFFSGDKKLDLRQAKKVAETFAGYSTYVVALNGLTKGAADHFLGCMDLAVWGAEEMVDLVKDAPGKILFQT